MRMGRCEVCGETKENVHTNRVTQKDTCMNCYRNDPANHMICSKCGLKKFPATGRKQNKPVCFDCNSRATHQNRVANGHTNELETNGVKDDFEIIKIIFDSNAAEENKRFAIDKIVKRGKAPQEVFDSLVGLERAQLTLENSQLRIRKAQTNLEKVQKSFQEAQQTLTDEHQGLASAEHTLVMAQQSFDNL